jgi:uncharacterized protein (TIGR02271 family)
MTTTEHLIVVGVFRDHSQAAQAIEELHKAGCRDDKIRVGKTATASGLLDGLASRWNGFEVEGRTLPDELVSKGMSQDEADYYLKEFEAGHSIVIVESSGHQEEVRDILQRHGAYDASRVGIAQEQASSGQDCDEQTEGDRTISVREEVLQPHKQLIEIGEVILRKEVITEEKTITVPVSREELVVERRPATPEASDQPMQEGKIVNVALEPGETFKIVLHEEQVRVEKYPVVKEEIFISKRQTEETRSLTDRLKREEVHIERVGDVPIREKKE